MLAEVDTGTSCVAVGANVETSRVFVGANIGASCVTVGVVVGTLRVFVGASARTS